MVLLAGRALYSVDLEGFRLESKLTQHYLKGLNTEISYFLVVVIPVIKMTYLIAEFKNTYYTNTQNSNFHFRHLFT